jgi:hypothetical protein
MATVTGPFGASARDVEVGARLEGAKAAVVAEEPRLAGVIASRGRAAVDASAADGADRVAIGGVVLAMMVGLGGHRQLVHSDFLEGCRLPMPRLFTERRGRGNIGSR